MGLTSTARSIPAVTVTRARRAVPVALALLWLAMTGWTFSIARDSARSVRAPAPCSWLFSLRPSFGSTSMEGIPVNSPMFDTVGQFGRSLDDLHYIMSHTFENIGQNFARFPSKILYPAEFYPLA